MADFIITWSEVREGDLVLLNGVLRKVMAAPYLHHLPLQVGERVHVELRGIPTPKYFLPAELIAVRRDDQTPAVGER